MMSKLNERSSYNLPRPEGAQEQFWRIFAVATICVTITGIMISFGVIFNISSGLTVQVSHLEDKIDLVCKIAIMGAGVATFSAAVWGRLLSRRQADAQLHALDNQVKQIELASEQIQLAKMQADAVERNELAKLLQKGAELIASDMDAHHSAGIATLHSVARAGKMFSSQAVDLIAEYVERIGQDGTMGRSCKRAISILSDIHAISGNIGTSDLVFKAKFAHTEWSDILCVRSVEYNGGVLDLKEKQISEDQRYSIQGVMVKNGKINLRRGWFGHSTFNKCRVYEITQYEFMYCNFLECDFSDCTIYIIDLEFFNKSMSGEGNYYNKGSPPSLNFERDMPIDESSGKNVLMWFEQNIKENYDVRLHPNTKY